MIYQYIRLDYLDTIAGDDQQLRKTLLDLVQKELAASIPSMEQALEQKNWDVLHHHVHQLKSTLAFVGNPELSSVNQLILSNLEEKNYQADFATWVAQYGKLYDPIAEELLKEFNK